MRGFLRGFLRGVLREFLREVLRGFLRGDLLMCTLSVPFQEGEECSVISAGRRHLPTHAHHPQHGWNMLRSADYTERAAVQTATASLPYKSLPASHTNHCQSPIQIPHKSLGTPRIKPTTWTGQHHSFVTLYEQEERPVCSPDSTAVQFRNEE